MPPTDHKTVLVDMDGVLCDFDAAVLGGLAPDVARVARVNFYIAHDYPEHTAAVAAVYNNPDFFFDLPPVQGAIEGWAHLLELGYEPRICSAPLTKNPKSVEGKVAWLRKYLVPRYGEDVIANAIFDKEKHRYPGVALIDDRPNVQSSGAEWTHVVFDQPYNRELSADIPRLHGWGDPELPDLLSAVTQASR